MFCEKDLKLCMSILNAGTTILFLNIITVKLSGIELTITMYFWLAIFLCFNTMCYLFPNGRYIDCLSLTYATNKGKMLKWYYINIKKEHNESKCPNDKE